MAPPLVQPAWGSGTLECEIDDKQAKLSLQTVVSHGVGEVMTGLTGELALPFKEIPEDLRKIAFEKAHLTQSWLYGPDLRLRLYRERAEGEPHGYVELIIVTRRKGRDEVAPYAGTYELTVHALRSKEETEGKTVKAKGKVTCSIG